MKRLSIALLLMLALLLSMASAEETPTVALDILEATGESGSFVRYPVLSGGNDAQASALERINLAIRETARIDDYLLLLQTVTDGGTGLKMTCEYALGERYVSVLLSAEGKMLAGRPSQIYYPMTFDLTTGERLTFDELCDDPQAARAEVERVVENEIEPALSAYLAGAALLPVPFDNFFFSGDFDITFYYDNADFAFLSGRSGAVSLRYNDFGAISTCEGAPASDLSPSDDHFLADAKEGRYRTLAVGDSLAETLARYPALSDSGYYPGGAYYETEDARLRGTYILTDEAETVVTGILATRTDGELVTGATTRDAWRSWLGEPTMTMPLAGEAARSYLLCDGESDYYLFGDRQLILHADENGVLYAMILK